MMRLLERYSCPVRMDGAEADLLDRGRNDSDRWTRKGACSHCGSMRPEAFLAAITDGMVVVTDEGASDAAIYDPAGRLAGRIDFRHLDEAQRAKVRSLGRVNKINMGDIELNYWF